MNKTNFRQALAVSGLALVLTGCSTISSVTDAINPFDKTDAERRAEQGSVAGDSDRISILELSETLEVKDDADAVVLPPAYVNVDWPQVGGNTTHVVQHTGASGPLEVSWSKDIGKGSGRKTRVLSPPVIAGGVIYTMDGGNRVSAFSEAEGSKLWEFNVSVAEREKTRVGKVGIIERIRDPLSFTDGSGRDKEGVGGGVAYENGTLFISSGLGALIALDAETGSEKWRYEGRVPMHSAPVISDGRVFVITDDNELYAFNTNTGEVLWTYQSIVEMARMLTLPAPAIIDDVIIAPFSSGEIVALRVQNGGVLWQDSLSSSSLLTPLASLNDIAAGPAVADGYVIASAQSGVMSAFDLRTGQRIWRQPAGTIGIPLIAGDYVFSVTTEGQLVCMSKIDGSVIWLQQLESFKNAKKRKKRIVWAGPILAGNRLFLVSSKGRTVVVSPTTGEIISEGKVGKDVYVPPIIANETIYIVTDEARLIAIR
ncbi:outer membrane protein assembly factor BamB [Litorimonas taeanensis]|uniref:Outer membrane protein assembly factor BamB n=1 Tax=Litorimonas taeanensis TaxID=568099 RepID=A0A420WKN1_9PROT|nr:PQQ-like beta-propeller repeat protein [Litorimonas taeanensis]RKQ71577.1 outer membrane protein assembly factor BamB [Litorimonas taeanensis]